MKLTNHHRDTIAGRAISFAYGPKHEAQADESDKLAREAHAFIVSDAEMALIGRLPKHWFCRSSTIILNVGGRKLALYLKGSDALPIPWMARGSQGSEGSPTGIYNPMGAIPHGDLCDRIQRHADAVETLKQDRKDAHKQVRAMLNAFTTDKALREGWPEGESFYADLTPAPIGLPAVMTADINKRLGLPPETSSK